MIEPSLKARQVLWGVCHFSDHPPLGRWSPLCGHGTLMSQNGAAEAGIAERWQEAEASTDLGGPILARV